MKPAKQAARPRHQGRIIHTVLSYSIIANLSYRGAVMQPLHASEWIDRCSKRLQEQWRTVPPEQLDDVAIELWGQPQWRALPPEQAALDWLKQGVLAST